MCLPTRVHGDQVVVHCHGRGSGGNRMLGERDVTLGERDVTLGEPAG
jgi:hypothetical protein